MTAPQEPHRQPDTDKLLKSLILWLNGDQFGAIIRPYGEEKIVMVLDYERTIKQIKAMWPRAPHPAAPVPYSIPHAFPPTKHTTLEEHDAAIAKAERERVLKEYLEILNSELPDYDVRARLKHLMRGSLRQPEQP